MSVRKLYYLACTNCNDQFRTPAGGNYAESAREILNRARSEGWRRLKVENGSMWDFCPRCLWKHNGETP